MAQSSDSAQTGNQQSPVSSTGGNKHILRYVIIAVIVIVIIVILFYPFGSSTPAVSQTSSVNSTAISMSKAQAQSLLGTPVAYYNVSDFFSPVSVINISDYLQYVPQLYSNASSGWVTYANSTSSVTNASVMYVVITTNNTVPISTLLGSMVTSSLGFAPIIAMPGSRDGLNYNYSVYENSTSYLQLLYGWKNRNAVLVVVQANPPFLVNESALVGTIANDTP